MSNIQAAKNLGIQQNVTFRVRDRQSGKICQEVKGHNAATNSLLFGIGHYLKGDGVLNQGGDMLSNYVPRYISLGTMGLLNQNQDTNYLPTGIGGILDSEDTPEDDRFVHYMQQCPGYGSDGYDENLINGRQYFGLGPEFNSNIVEGQPEQLLLGDINLDGVVDSKDLMLLIDYNCGVVQLSEKQLLVADVNQDGVLNCEDVQLLKNHISDPDKYTFPTQYITYRPKTYQTFNCELISDTFPRQLISYRELIPETKSELPKTVDIVFSAMISTGALKQFRYPGNNYIFITEAGLWSRQDYVESGGDNGLLAGYRIVPPNSNNWGMSVDAISDENAIYYLKNQASEKVENPTADQIQAIKPEMVEYNKLQLRSSILRVGVNQVVEVIWKIQLGALEELLNI